MSILIVLGIIALVAFVAACVAMSWRVVVPTNEIHVVRSRKASTAYGYGHPKNVYYKVPPSIPAFGIVASVNPIDIFNVPLNGYDGYDANKVPFEVDVQAFFQITDAIESSMRVSDFDTLSEQLDQVLKGGVRKVLASYPVDEIMASRSKLSAEFVSEVSEQTKNWGVKVNSIEFMDIRDSAGSQAITQIMAKEKSTIEKDSRVKVAENSKIAQTAEIESAREVALRQVDQKKQVAVETEKASQDVADQQNATKLKQMAIRQTEIKRQAEIDKEKIEIDAAAQANSQIKMAEGFKSSQVLEAEGNAAKVSRAGAAQAEATKATGLAEAEVVKAKGLAQAEATEAQALALQKMDGSALNAKKIEAAITMNAARWEATAKAYEGAEIKLIQPGNGPKFLGVDLNSETGANLDGFLDQLPDSLKEKAASLIGSMTKKNKE